QKRRPFAIDIAADIRTVGRGGVELVHIARTVRHYSAAFLAGAPAAPRAINASTSASLATSNRISRLCSPKAGAPRRIEVGASEYFTGWPMTRSDEPWREPISCTMPRAKVCG